MVVKSSIQWWISLHFNELKKSTHVQLTAFAIVEIITMIMRGCSCVSHVPYSTVKYFPPAVADKVYCLAQGSDNGQLGGAGA